MPARILTENEKKDNKIKNLTKKYMSSVRAFLSKKNKNGEVAPEWECSLMLLEEYYKQFLLLTEEINKLDSLVVVSRYGEVPNALLTARDKTAIRIEAMLKQLGCTFKEQAKMDIVEPVVEESPLSQWVQKNTNNIEKRGLKK